MPISSSRRIAALLAVAALPAAGAGAALGGSRSAAEVPTTIPVAQQQPFRQPPELRSRDRVLRHRLVVADTTFDFDGTKVRGKSFDGSFVGPTLRVRPGDTIALRLVNELGQPTNLHTHGFHVSPSGISDNVLRVMPADSSNRVLIRIPPTMAPGTYWYHPHKHMIVEEQVFSGMSGALIVEGLRPRLPRALRDVPEHLVALKDLQVRDGAIPTRNIDSGAPTTRTVNGLVDPVLHVRTGATQLLRLANIGADIWYRVALDGARFSVIAEDGNPVGRVWGADRLLLPPGKRFDVLVRWPRAGTYRLRTLKMSTGPAGDVYPPRVLSTVEVSGAAAPAIPMPRSLGALPGLGRAHVARRRVITFSENSNTNQFFINGRQFRHNTVDQYAKLGDVEQWVLRNTSHEKHPFHLHVDDFEVLSIGGRPYHARGLQDTVPLRPGRDVVIRMHFKDFTGKTVFHCHILNHEDHGMMSVIAINRSGRAPRRAGGDHGHGTSPHHLG